MEPQKHFTLSGLSQCLLIIFLLEMYIGGRIGFALLHETKASVIQENPKPLVAEWTFMIRLYVFHDFLRVCAGISSIYFLFHPKRRNPSVPPFIFAFQFFTSFLATLTAFHYLRTVSSIPTSKEACPWMADIREDERPNFYSSMDEWCKADWWLYRHLAGYALTGILGLDLSGTILIYAWSSALKRMDRLQVETEKLREESAWKREEQRVLGNDCARWSCGIIGLIAAGLVHVMSIDYGMLKEELDVVRSMRIPSSSYCALLVLLILLSLFPRYPPLAPILFAFSFLIHLAVTYIFLSRKDVYLTSTRLPWLKSSCLHLQKDDLPLGWENAKHYCTFFQEEIEDAFPLFKVLWLALSAGIFVFIAAWCFNLYIQAKRRETKLDSENILAADAAKGSVLPK
ncbi:hypothetical protein BT69DRAFT_1350230 [Atractiella rhizophila]|nr:hypothetical protein BT69DRAFT_1350230 [Atractiella rhizophila]